MPDASLLWGGDFLLSAVGDVSLADGTLLTQQRLLRRLLTNPGDYFWHPSYGGGLAQFVGDPCDATKIKNIIRSQVSEEVSVAASPEPTIDVSATPEGNVFVNMRYVDAPSGSTQLLSFSIEL